eukprot:Polyplicarium_translucidae@DN2628_c1_g1_i1.p1
MSSFQHMRSPQVSGSRPQPTKAPRPELKAGDVLPCVKINMHGEVVDLKQYFEDRTGVIFGAPGAFTPTCTKEHVPGIRDAADEIRRHVDFVGCVLVNDPFVVKAWAKKLHISDQLTFIADTNAKFVSAVGLTQNLSNLGMGVRPKRFAMIVGPRAVVKWIGFEKDAYATEVLKQLPTYLRAPWKSFLVGVGGENNAFAEACKERVEAMKTFFTSNQQGFSGEEDWQLVITGSCTDEVSPTKDNIMNGMRWLVEGAQAGDSLLFYYCGRSMRLRAEDGSTEESLLPADWRTSGGIPASFIYEALIQQLPQRCRLTIVLDTHGGGSAIRLPYVLRATEGGLESGFDRSWEIEELDRLINAGEGTPDRVEELKTLREKIQNEHDVKPERREELRQGVKGEVLLFTVTEEGKPADKVGELPPVADAHVGACGAALIESVGHAVPFASVLQKARAACAVERPVVYSVSSTRPLKPSTEFSTVDPL